MYIATLYSHRDHIINVFKGEKKDGIVIVILHCAVVAQVVIHFLLTLVCVRYHCLAEETGC